MSNRDDVEQRLIDICVKGVPNYFGAQRFGIGGSNLQGAQRWAQTNTRCAIAINGVFGCRQPAVRCLIRLLLSASKADVNQVVDGDALQLAGRGSWFVATTEELAELQRRVNDKELMITAALPAVANGELSVKRWHSNKQLSPQKLNYKLYWCAKKLKPRAERCCCIRNN